MEEKKTPVWKKALSVISLWVMTWVGGPVVVGILNLLAPLLFWRDTQQPGSFGYMFLLVISGAVGVAIGASIMNALTGKDDGLFRFVNFVILATTVAAIYFVMIVALGYSEIAYILQAILVVVVCISYALSEKSALKKQQ